MKKTLFIISLITILSTISIFAQKSSKNSNSIKTVALVNLNKYVGKWFEIARYPNRFQKKCVGEVTATYKLKDSNKIEAINECLKQDGKKQKAKGKAKIVDKTTNAKLKVRFAPSWLSWLPQVFWGDYWVLDLDKDYKYAVVGAPDKDYLWVISREPKLEKSIFEDILDKVEKLRFNPAKLINTPQNVQVVKGEVITKPKT